MSAKLLLRITAVAEGLTGAAFVVAPSVPALILFARPLEAPVAQVIARVLGAALLAIAIACWRASLGAETRAASDLPAAMLLYNIVTAVILIYAGAIGLAGIALWPAAIGHALLALWCILALQHKKRESRVGITN